MIQDIAPYRLNNSFRRVEGKPEDIVFVFNDGKVLTCMDEDDKVTFPKLKQLIGDDFSEGPERSKKQAVYVFSVDEAPMFLIFRRDFGENIPKGMEYRPLRSLGEASQSWMAFAAVTASHINHWYEEHRYCGCCGSPTALSERERATVCPKCGNIQYPRISPVVMAAVTHGDRILVTRYAGRPYKGLALIAGFVEIGESIEAALEREVMEEVGLKVKNLRYFGSQPWGFSDSVISGFFAELDGSSSIRLDRDELSEAVWMKREELPNQEDGISITAAMIEAFRKGIIL